MAEMVFSYKPNTISIQSSAADESEWNILGDDGVLYESLAALKSGGTTPFPTGQVPNGVFGSIDIKSVATGGVTDGGPFRFIINPQTTPSGTVGTYVSGSGQWPTTPDMYVNQVWIFSTTVTDLYAVEFRY